MKIEILQNYKKNINISKIKKKMVIMKNDILDNNSDYIEKMAKNNYLDFQKKELEKLIK